MTICRSCLDRKKKQRDQARLGSYVCHWCALVFFFLSFLSPSLGALIETLTETILIDVRTYLADAALCVASQVAFSCAVVLVNIVRIKWCENTPKVNLVN